MERFVSSRRDFVKYASVLAACGPYALFSLKSQTSVAQEKKKQALPNPSPHKLPRWRGFNLLEKFNGTNNPFREDDFRNISDLGFNFVRLPMDYRAWIVNGDKRKFNEKTLSEIDQALEYGVKYGIHVNLNFHRAPGYTVANPPESPLVWHDKETLDICKLHWQTFAERYRAFSNDQLSFNLFNEPANCTEQEYFNVVKLLAEAIHEKSPGRLIICDGINWGGSPCLSFKELNVAQATRGYAPTEISHFGASWVNSKDFPEPQWPSSSFNALLPSVTKTGMAEGLRKPLLIKGPFPKDATLHFHLGTVSVSSEIVVECDGKESYRHLFESKAGKGEWKESIYNEQYGVYQNVYDLDVSVPIPSGAKIISIANLAGDWATITRLTISSKKEGDARSEGAPDWNAKEETTLQYEVGKDGAHLAGGTFRDRQWLWKNNVEPWLEAEKQGIGVMVGEFGSHNVTPSPVALRWMEDMLINWKEANWGWALWNFRGSFGVADSGRKDVNYEDWRGLKLDRKMLELLQRY